MDEYYDRFGDDDDDELTGKFSRPKRREARGDFEEEGGRGRRSAGRRHRRGDRRRRDEHWA